MKILAMDVGGTAVKSAIVDDSYNLSDVRLTPSLPKAGVPDPDIMSVKSATLVAKEYSDYDVLAISMTGQIDEKRKVKLYRNGDGHGSPRPPIEAGEILERATGRPVFILNDCNAAALGEAVFGRGRGYKDFLCLTYGTGVGGAIVQNGALFTGKRGIAGEIGHMITHVGGRKCSCGGRGCYEQYASSTALLSSARKISPEIKNVKELFEINGESGRFSRMIGSWEREIAAGLISLAHIFNPECIILGGGVMEEKSVLRAIVMEFRKGAMLTFSDVNIVSASLGNQAGMLGAAVYAREELNKNTR